MTPGAGGPGSGRAEDGADARAGGVLSTPACSAMLQARLVTAAPAGVAWETGGAGRLPAGIAVRIRLLGRFTVLQGAEEVPLRAFGGRRAQQLLRLLAVRRGVFVSKDVIAEALWPRRRPADAAGNIEVLVSRVRRALGDPALIRTGSGGYSLTAGSRCWVDAEAFVAAVRDGRRLLAGRPGEALIVFRGALEVWCGESLAEDAYAEWPQVHRRRLSQALLEALEGAAAAALLTGDPREAASIVVPGEQKESGWTKTQTIWTVIGVIVAIIALYVAYLQLKH